MKTGTVRKEKKARKDEIPGYGKQNLFLLIHHYPASILIASESQHLSVIQKPSPWCPLSPQKITHRKFPSVICASVQFQWILRPWSRALDNVFFKLPQPHPSFLQLFSGTHLFVQFTEQFSSCSASLPFTSFQYSMTMYLTCLSLPVPSAFHRTSHPAEWKDL